MRNILIDRVFWSIIFFSTVKIAFPPPRLILLMCFLALATACNKHSSSNPSAENTKKTTEADENNPLNFTVDDINKDYTNVQGPKELADHPGWWVYQAERNGTAAYFWVKDGAVYSVSISNSQDVESLLPPYSNGKSWKYIGVGAIEIFREWQRDDKEAWCEAVTDKQKGFTDIAIKTKASNRIAHSTQVVSTAPLATSPNSSQDTVGGKDTTTQPRDPRPTMPTAAITFDTDRIKRAYSDRGYTLQYINRDPTQDFVMVSVRNCSANFTLAKGHVTKIEVRTMRFRSATTADEELENLKVGVKEVCDATSIINPIYNEKFGNWYWSCVQDGFQHPGYASSVTLGGYRYEYSTNGLDSIVGVSASK